jgi:uncharacterized membrane protein YbhN (UPF0104 family)
MSKKNLLNLLSLALVVAIFYYLIKVLIDNWHSIRIYEFHFKYSYLFLSIFLYVIGTALNSLIAKRILEKSGYSFDWVEIYFINSVSELAKYVPGRVFLYLVRFGLFKGRLPKKIFATFCLLETAIVIMASLLFSVPIVYYYLPGFFKTFIPALIIGGFLIFIFSAKLFYKFVNFSLKLLKRKPLTDDIQLKTKDLVYCSILSLITWFTLGTAFFIFVNSLISIDPKYFLFINALFVFSYNASILVAVAPAGLGVREGFLTFLLNKILSLTISVFISIISRIWLVVNDIIIAIISSIIFHLKRLLTKNEETNLQNNG